MNVGCSREKIIFGSNNHPMARIVQTNSPELFARVWNKKSCPKVFLPSQRSAVRNNNSAMERNEWRDLDSNPSEMQRRRSRSRSRSRESDKREYRKSLSRCIHDHSEVYDEDFSDHRLSNNRDYIKRNRRRMSPAEIDRDISVIEHYSCSSGSDAKSLEDRGKKSRRKRSYPNRNKRREFFDYSRKPRYHWDSELEDWEDALTEDKTLLTQAAIGLCLCFGLTFCLS